MFRILHLSDLHAREDKQWSSDALLSGAQKILLKETNKRNIDVLAFTGDIAYSGKTEEYDIAAKWIEDFCLSSTGLNLDPSRLLFVPGNHDVDRRKLDAISGAIELELAGAKNHDDAAKHLSVLSSREKLLQRHEAYAEFVKRVRGDDHLSLPSWSQEIDIPGRKIVFEGYCSSWLCSKDDNRRLLVGQPQITDRIRRRPDCDMLVALVHHPLSHLIEFDENNFEQHLRANHTLLLRGHLHNPDPVQRQADTGSYLELAAGALHDHYEATNSFSIIDILDDFSEAHIRVFTWYRTQWVFDRNIFPETHDGIGRFRLPNRDEAEASTPASALTESVSSTIPIQEEELNVLESSPGQKTVALDKLSEFPRFRHKARPQDIAVREHQQETAIAAAEQDRIVEIRSEWGVDANGFVAAIIERWRKTHPELIALHVLCSGAANGKQLQDALAIAASGTIPEMAAVLRFAGPCILLLDDVGVSYRAGTPDGDSTRETLIALLDYCPDLVFIAGLPAGAPFDAANSANMVRLGPLDSGDTREYLRVHNEHPITLPNVDCDRVCRSTGGLPSHLDALAEALSYTDLNNALADFDHTQNSSETHLPSVIVEDIANLATATDDPSLRANILLSALSVLERGELLSVIKRIIPEFPLWPGHAKRLEDAGLLDVIDTSPQSYEPKRSSITEQGEKVLRVPRVVRDHVLSKLTTDQQLKLVVAAATLYFGSDWRQGTVRMRRRPALSPAVSAHRFTNEMALIRFIVFQHRKEVTMGPENAFALLLSYTTFLQEKNYYGEAYEAAREFIGMVDNDEELAELEIEMTELKLVAGKSARMIGEREAAVDLLSAALPNARRTKSRPRMCDVLLSLAMAHEGLGNKHEAITACEEVIRYSVNNTSDDLQAKAILAGFTEDKADRVGQLKRLHRRAQNFSHYTVADNIALDLAKEAGDPDEVLKHLAMVRTRRELEYNYVRATIRRVETLVKAGRSGEVNDLDRDDLERSYGLAYTQRLHGIFSWCHRVTWAYYEAINDHERQRALFVHSSLLWRLNGERDEEAMYAGKLVANMATASSGIDSNDPVMRYCRIRLASLKEK